MGQKNSSIYSPVSKDKDLISIELHNRLDKEVTFRFFHGENKKCSRTNEHTVSALSHITVSISPKAEVVYCEHDPPGDYGRAELNLEDICTIFTITGFTEWMYLNKGVSPWILIFGRFDRDNVSIRNKSTENISVIRKLDTVVVPPKSFMEFSEYVDVATSSGRKLCIKTSYDHSKDGLYPKMEPITYFKKDELEFNCRYTSNKVKIVVTNKEKE